MSQTIPTTQKAIIVDDSGNFVESSNVPVMQLEPDAVIIKVAAVALNPVDTKMLGDFATPGAILGFDCAGTVVAVGRDVGARLKPGDRVCGSADGMNRFRPLSGGFAEYVSLPGDLALKIPEGMSFEAAAPLGTALASAGMALFASLKLPATLTEPASAPFWVLVNGGSTSTGTMMIQLLKLCNLRVVTTCSPRNFALVKSYGADAVFDYNSPTCAQDIRKFTEDALEYAVDCVTLESSMKLCYAAIGRAGGSYTALDPFPETQRTRKAITPDWILATQVTGNACSWPAPYGRDGSPELRAWANTFFEQVQKALNERRIRGHPAKVSPDGFAGVLEGVGIIRRGEVSGQKLVYSVA
ncbi:alcohol dehydrogenase [Lasiodiplodia theobromae]|uniref:alcohol dehydrogenase n=1 Tax=Lasiodiplodia theobromae TaxID=45133 RepID=UPI0015C3C4C7|nr:alcohol dehydrogenase [Lasiodiplodia theobromae]KAF4541987.1 alcohol dehydrogenase [Lasiodiplodia theobromae]